MMDTTLGVLIACLFIFAMGFVAGYLVGAVKAPYVSGWAPEEWRRSDSCGER